MFLSNLLIDENKNIIAVCSYALLGGRAKLSHMCTFKREY